MNFAPPPRRTALASAVPAINVAFLLLVFFLLASRVAPPDPLRVDLPESAAEGGSEPEGAQVLLLSAGGEVALGDLRGAEALAGLTPGAPVLLRADRAAPGAELAALLSRLAALGAGPISLSVVPR